MSKPGQYGYRSRPAQQPGLEMIRTPPSVLDPRTYEPRGVNQAVKDADEAATATLRTLHHVVQCDGQRMFGIQPNGTNEGGPGSTTVTDQAWWSEIGRYCRYVEVISTGTDDKRVRKEAMDFNLSPIAWLDPSKPKLPCIFRMEDIIAARINSPSAGKKAAFHFGLTWENAIGVALAAPKPFIGIYANWAATAYGTWTARCVNDSGSGHDQSLGITTELPHRLCYEIDGRGVVNFYIDGILSDSYEPAGGDLPTHTAFAISHRWTAAADNGATLRCGYWMDLQANQSVEVLDEAA